MRSSNQGNPRRIGKNTAGLVSAHLGAFPGRVLLPHIVESRAFAPVQTHHVQAIPTTSGGEIRASEDIKEKKNKIIKIWGKLNMFLFF